MNKECIQLRELLKSLKKKRWEYGLAFEESLKGKEFANMGGLKDELKEKIQKLKENTKLGKFLIALRIRFNELPELHYGIEWKDVEKSLKADREAMGKIYALDEKGHRMNVFGEENGELIFVSAWDNDEQVSREHRNIAFDKEAEKLLAEKYPDDQCNDNATDIAKALGVDLADQKFHQQLQKAVQISATAWLKTDAATRKTGKALSGYGGGINLYAAHVHNYCGSFRAALRVKKV